MTFWKAMCWETGTHGLGRGGWKRAHIKHLASRLLHFMTDSLYDGRRFQMLTLVDTATRECPAIEVGQSLTGQWVVAVLNRLKATRGLPRVISVDNGPEFISKAVDGWAHEHGVQLEFSRPGTPTDNPYIEAFNGRFRDECLDQHWFASLEDARLGLLPDNRTISCEKIRPIRTRSNR